MARKRRGSRLLLGVSLIAGTFGAMYAAALLADAMLDFFGVFSRPARLAAKALCLAAALPAGFFAVERCFLAWSSRRAPGRNGESGPKRR